MDGQAMRARIFFLIGILILTIHASEPVGPLWFASGSAEAGLDGEMELPPTVPGCDGQRRDDWKAEEEKRFEELRQLEDELVRLRRRLEDVRGECRNLRRKALVRLVALYKFKQIGYATPLFLANNRDEALNGLFLAEKLMANDHEILLDLLNCSKIISNVESETIKKEEKIRALKDNLQTCEQELLVLDEGKGASRAVGIRQKDLYAKSYFELERSLLILERRAKNRRPIFDFDWTPFSKRKGALPFPTQGEITETYASINDVSSRSILYNGGVIIKAPAGQSIQAVHEGVVIFADWLADYGNVMIIDHGNHYKTLIAHAERLLRKTGDVVKGSDVIATVGNTGSNGEAKLYFEIRHHGRPVDPAEWLAAYK